MRHAFIVFIASFCTLVIEIVAGRILAPFVGVSLYTWTSIIGVVLAGISAGAWWGGRLADRRPQPSTLGWLLLASGVTALLIPLAVDTLAPTDGLLSSLTLARSLPVRVVLLSFLLFFIPSCFLGMISPVVVRLAVGSIDTTGRTVGRLYALSTLGSIAGTFFTGFFLVARFGTRATLFGVAAVLIVTALLAGDLLGRTARAALLLFLTASAFLFALGPRSLNPPLQQALLAPEAGTLHREESQYYTIRVLATVDEDEGRPLRTLELDHLTHSYSDLRDPGFLYYRYLRIFHDVIRWKAGQYEVARILFIGGGGYTLPRLIERTWPRAEIEVVEIDPAVTRVAHRFLGLPSETGIRTIHADARWFLMQPNETYDLIVIDAFNDLSVPYHLTTREFTELLRRRLTPDGAIVANVIDHFSRGRFLASYVRTLQQVFGEPNATVMVESEEDMGDVQSTFVVVASPSLRDLMPALQASTNGQPIPPQTLQHYLRERRAVLLTDDYVPVDNMLAPLFRERFADEAAQ